MQKNDARSDNWALLASELGVDDPNVAAEIEESISVQPLAVERQPEASAAVVEKAAERIVEKTVVSFEPENTFGKGLLDETPETSSVEPLLTEPFETPVPPKSREGKKNFFDRFPKINLFGTSTKASLAAVVEGVKSPSLSGKSFTSSKLEKVPVSHERVARREKDHKSFELDDLTSNTETADTVKVAEKISIPAEQTDIAVEQSDPWSKIASQVGTLSVASVQAVQPMTKPFEAQKTGERSVRKNSETTDNAHYSRRGQPQRALPSMFDEPATESEESVALKSLIGTDLHETDEAERRLRSIFDEETEPASFAASADRTPKPSYPKQREESRGSRFRDRRSDTKPETRENVQEKTFATNLDKDRFENVDRRNEFSVNRDSVNRERGRRGSRYEQREEREETKLSEVGEAMWDIEEESKPVERSSRGKRRRDPRTESFAESFSGPERRPFSEKRNGVFESETSSEDYDFTQIHKNIPSWDDAINLLIESNIARHSQGQGVGTRNNNNNNRSRR